MQTYLDFLWHRPSHGTPVSPGLITNDSTACLHLHPCQEVDTCPQGWSCPFSIPQRELPASAQAPWVF